MGCEDKGVVFRCPSNIAECPHAGKAAEQAVRKVFAVLGVDIDVPKEVEAFREDLRFGAHMRRAADKWQMAMIGVLAAGAVYALLAGIAAKVSSIK